MPPIGMPVMKPMTSAGTIGMNGSMSITSSNHAQRNANAATSDQPTHANPDDDSAPVQHAQLLD